MKLTKDEQIKLLNESIQQLMQENTELKDKIEFLEEVNLYKYNEGYASGFTDADERC